MPEITEPKVDVVTIMREIRESIQEKRQRGVYSEGDVEELARAKLRSYADEAFIDPKLLDRLTKEFIDSDFDVRKLIKTICKSRVYQHALVTTK